MGYAQDSLRRHQSETFSMQTKAAAASTGSGAAVEMIGSGGRSSMFGGGAGSAKAQEEYRQFDNWVYVAINAISKRAARQMAKMAKVAGSGGIKGLTRWTKNYNVFTKHITDGRFGAKIATRGDKAAIFNAKYVPHHIKSSADSDMSLIERHPLLDAIKNPNPVMTKWPLIYMTCASMMITGRAYWWIFETNNEVGESIINIWPIPSGWVTPIHANGKLNYAYRISPPRASGKWWDIPGEQIAPFTLPDPSNPLSSISPLRTQSKAVKVDEMIQVAQEKSMENGLFPGVVLTAGRLPDVAGIPGERPVLTADQRNDLITAVKGVYQGVITYGEPIIVDGLIEDVKPFTNTPAEMAFLESGTSVKSRIFSAFSLNPIIVGEIAGVNRAQAAVAEDNFNANAVNPVLELIGEVMTRWIGQNESLAAFGSSGDVLIWFEPAEADDVDLELERYKFGEEAGCLTKNEIRIKILKLPPMEGGDDLPDAVPLPDRRVNQVAGKRGKKPPADDNTDDNSEEEPASKGVLFRTTKSSNLHRVEYIGKNSRAHMWLSNQKGFEANVASVLEKFFLKQAAEVKQKIEDSADTPGKHAGSAAYRVASTLIDIPGDTKKLIKNLQPYLLETASTGAITELSSIINNKKAYGYYTKGMNKPSGPKKHAFEVDIPQSMITSAKDALSSTFQQSYWKGINETTRDKIYDIIERGVSAGRSEKQIADDVYKSIVGMTKSRAKGIARTEVTNMMNAGHYAAAMSVDEYSTPDDKLLIGLTWWTMDDGDVRKSHISMHKKTVKAGEMFKIPLPENTRKGKKKRKSVEEISAAVLGAYEEAPWPGYWTLSAGNRVWCRCTIVSQTKYDAELEAALS